MATIGPGPAGATNELGGHSGVIFIAVVIGYRQIPFTASGSRTGPEFPNRQHVLVVYKYLSVLLKPQPFLALAINMN